MKISVAFQIDNTMIEKNTNDQIIVDTVIKFDNGSKTLSITLMSFLSQIRNQEFVNQYHLMLL